MSRFTIETHTSKRVTVVTWYDIELGLLVGPWSLIPRTFPGCRAPFLFPLFYFSFSFAAFCSVHAKNESEHNPHIRT